MSERFHAPTSASDERPAPRRHPAARRNNTADTHATPSTHPATRPTFRSASGRRVTAVQRLVDAYVHLSGDATPAQRVAVVQRNGLANDITHNHYQKGQLTTTLNYNDLKADRQTKLKNYLDSAALQYASGFFHGNEAGLLPANGWESRDCSRYIEFNLAFQAFNRVIYDAQTQNLYLTPHYDGYVRINNPPASAVNHMEATARTNVSYVLMSYDANDDPQAGTAWGKIQALHQHQEQEQNDE